MVEGQSGKRQSHRCFRVTNIPPELAARPGVAGGIGGPLNQPFTDQGRKRLIDWIGTGYQAVVPPSLGVSKDGTWQERREWDVFEEPAIVGCQVLFEQVCRLASACGLCPTKTAV